MLPHGSLYKGLRSHVLLAACSEDETAGEKSGRGLFTVELVTRLEITEGKISYYHLIMGLPEIKQ